MAKNKNIPSVLAFEKKLVPSDGHFYGTTWENRQENGTALKLQEKSVRGTISNRLTKASEGDPSKLNAKVESPNLQKVDHCALTPENDTLKLQFTLKVLSGVETPSACNKADFSKTYKEAVQQYIKENNFTLLAQRYATNIANGRFLWRNRVGAENIEVVIKKLNGKEKASWTFDAFDVGIHEFDQDNEQIDSLSAEMAKALSGEVDFLLLEVTAYAQLGKAQEVYPSEELVLDKSNSKDKKSKILYQINDVAGMHSQKIGNALRTIDTWYTEYETTSNPIAIEPYGAVTNLGKAFRPPTEKTDFFTLFDQFGLGGSLEEEQAHYVMAVLVRGGVFGERGKD